MPEYQDDALEQQAQDDAQSTTIDTGEKLPENYEDFFTTVTKPEEEAPQKYEEEPSSGDWEHKYKVLKGKYDKEVPRLTRELRTVKQEKDQLMQRISLLEQVVSEVMAKGGMATSQAPKQEEEDEELLRVKEDYPEIYKAVTKLVERKLTREVKPEIEQVKATTTQSAFYTRLASLVPQWQTINSDPDFLDWLSYPSEELPTKTRHQLMLLAFQEGDADAVATFFKRFIQQAKTNSEGEEVSMKSPAEKSVAPPYRKTAQSGKETSKRMFRESEIKDFYTNLALGKIPPDKRDALEQQILSAIMENRVIYGK